MIKTLLTLATVSTILGSCTKDNPTTPAPVQIDCDCNVVTSVKQVQDKLEFQTMNSCTGFQQMGFWTVGDNQSEPVIGECYN